MTDQRGIEKAAGHRRGGLRLGVACLAGVLAAPPAPGQPCPPPGVLRTADITSSPTQPGLQINTTIALRPGQTPGEALAFFLGYSLDDPPGGGKAIWQSDGTAAGTRRFSAPLNISTSSGLFPAATTTAVYFNASNRLYQATPDQIVQIEPTFNEWPSVTIGEHLLYALSSGVYSVRADASAPGGFVREQLVAPTPGWPGLAGGQFVQFAGEIYFTVSRLPTAYGGTIYATDGTPAGTRAVRTFSTLENSGAPAPSQFYVFGPRLYFSAYDDAIGQELWSTDGTPAGTTLFRNFHTAGSGSPAILGAAGGKLYVRAVIDYAPPLLDTFLIAISPDGSLTTRTGAANLRGIVPADRFPAKHVLDVGGKALFIARSGFTTQSYDLWATDGTGTFQGTQQLTSNLLQYNGSNEVIGVSVAGGTRAVVRVQPVTSSQARELWVTDGLTLNTARALDSTALGYESANMASRHLASDGQTAFFVAPGGGTIGHEPWVSDGTVAGTTLLKDLHTAPNTTSSAGLPCVLGPGRVVFAAIGTDVNLELFVSDGTPAGTNLVLDLAGGSNTSSIFGLYPSGSAAVIHASSALFASTPRPFVWDGSAVLPAAPTGPGVLGSPTPTFGVSAQGKTYLVGPSPIFCLDHATMQITAVGGVSGSTIRSGYSGNYPIAPGAPFGDGAVISGTMIGSAPQPTAEPAFIGPTPESCRIIQDLTPFGAQSNPQGFTALNGGVLFFANANNTGSEPWFTDGSAAGTVFLGDLNPVPSGSASGFNPGSWPVSVSGLGQSVEGPVVWNGRAYFPVQIDLPSNQFTSRMATTDGTPAGTAVLDLGVQVRGKFMAAAGPGVFFVGNPLVGSTSDTELHITDATLAGTRRVIDLTPGATGSLWNWLTSAGDRVYFSVGNTLSTVRGVYVSDGTETIRIDWPIAGEAPSTVLPLGTVRGEFFFAGQATTTSPWTIVRTRGTSAATLSTCIAASNLTQLFVPVTNVPGQGVAIATPSRLIFAARDPVLLQEPRAIDLCPADFNNSGNRPDMLDIFACLNAWFAGNPQADVDASGTLDSADLFAFLTAWFAGC